MFLCFKQCFAVIKTLMSFQMPLSGDFVNFDFDDGGVGERHGAVGDGLDAVRYFVAVVEHNAVKPCGAFLRIFD